MSEQQTTLKKEITMSGVGLHTGETVNITILPAVANHGYKFQRMDLKNQPVIKADADLVISTERGTTLEKNGVRIYTTEHLLASLYGMQVDNVLIQLDGPEIPIMDGSAMLFVNAIEEAGIEELKAERDYFEFQINQPYEDLDKGIEMLAIPYPEFRLTVMVDYESPVLGTQHANIYSIADFKKEIAPCRTFVFLRELEALARAGLIKGGDIDNAIVLVERDGIPKEELAELATLLGKEHLEVDMRGIGTLNNAELKFINEPARHKLLDIIGDLALIGKPIKGHILAARPGHSGNVSFAKIIKQIMNEQKGKKIINLNEKPLYDINDIKRMLPHRYPFLMVDKIMSITDDAIIGVKNVTANEPFFEGHFPDNPVMPGVLQIEAMAQVGGIFALSKVDEPEKYMTYFMKIDNVRFKRKVIPGDALVFDLKLITPIRRGIVHMRGTTYANGEPASEAEMMAQIIKEQ
ncbi:bifunctional UDP-3-O-[3-hydroxymyristoyl] N-acetylglucosamine deacetylase/3-hydroxyacyl-ACP dehydratase [Flavobacteriales bacterium]|nr:bifunctional UDP-3-O-[3-hydroxymyristoyl] N-acetylglucosamine deacetylase/3-hydroxyacyl-ACP dehydratase [Flavobacteriales bacterium]